MSKKLSYMNDKNILREGFFDKITNWWESLPKTSPKKKKNVSKKLKGSVNDLNKQVSKYDAILKKELGDDYPDLPRYKPEDFIK